jgi:uncharacterized membrane protein
MQFIKIFGMLLLVGVVTFVACTKEEKSKSEQLKGKNWTLTALTVNPPFPILFGTQTITDVYVGLDACIQDNTITFGTAPKLVVDEGAKKCNPNGPQAMPGTYTWNSTETIVSVNGVDWTVVEISASKMIVTFKEVSLGVTYTYTATYQ